MDTSYSDLFPIVLAIATLLAIIIVWAGLLEDNTAERRIKMLDARRSDLRSKLVQKSKKSDAVVMAKEVVDKLNLLPDSDAKGVAKELAQAGYRSREAIFIYTFLRLVTPLAGFALGFFLFYVLHVWDTTESTNLLIATLMTGLVCGLLPSIILGKIKSKRMVKLSRSLPDALDLFVICAEAGLSLDATFDRVSSEIAQSHPVISEEFGITSVELGFMPDRSKALQALYERCPLAGIRALVSTLIQTEKYGTPLAVSMRVLSVEMRNERMMKAEEKAARLPATMTVPMILFILPPLFIVILGPGYLIAVDAFK